MISKHLHIAACVLLLGASACRVSASVGNGEQGNGVAKTDTRDVTDFDEIQVDGTVKLELETGPLDRLTVTGDENLLPLIGTEVVGGRLVIHETKPVHSKTPLVVSVHAPAVARIDTSGVANVIASGLQGPSFTFTSTGVTDSQLSGQVTSLEIQSGGAGTVHAAGLAAKQVHVTLSGAGTVEVDATEKLKADVSGVGTVKYRGTPAIEKNVSGLGSVGPLG
jgi:hypothetical protein